jgi:hypothetical protein
MTKVKGTLIIDYVRIIRSNRQRNWDQWLTPEDWKIIDGQVHPSNWYPYDCFRRIGFAVFKEIANSDLKIAQQFGRLTIRNLLGIYKNVIAEGDVVASVKNFSNLRRTFIQGDTETKVAESGKNWLRYEMEMPGEEPDPDRLNAFAYQASGTVAELAEQAGAKQVQIEVKPAGDRYNVLLRWQ